MSVLQWSWTISSVIGVLISAWWVREAWGDYTTTRTDGNIRLILNARIWWRLMLSLLIAFVLFSAAGVMKLANLKAEFVPTVLVVALVQVVASALSSWRNGRRLHRLIEADIRRRRKEE